MKPVTFPGHNLTLAKNQPQYQQLPVCYEGGPEKPMTSCWKLSLWERIRVLFRGKIYFRQLTFGNNFQPMYPFTKWKDPKCLNCGDRIADHKEPNFICPRNLN